MINLPEFPFKVFDADENNHFIKNALRPRKHYEKCWCGSGRKYKKCHRIRGDLSPIPVEQMLDGQNEIFWRKRGCMHLMASSSVCQGKIIDSHSIQRKGPLGAIVDERNHVMHFVQSERDSFEAKLIGWNKASTFPGYCALHDSEVFSKLEREVFSGSHEQCVLQTYRSVTSELYKKRALIESLEYQRDHIDRGFSADDQISIQISYHESIEGQKKSVQEMEGYWRRLGEAVSSQNFTSFQSKVFWFTGDICVVSSSALHAEYDFQGNRLADMWDLSFDAEMIAHSVMNVDGGGAVIFVWESGNEASRKIVDSFEGVEDQAKGDVFIQYCFVNSENTFFSSSWWNQLADDNKAYLVKLASIMWYDGGSFEPRSPRLVDWNFI